MEEKEEEKEVQEIRYQELSKPYRIFLWLRWMPFGYIKGLGWYFIKRLRWEDCSEDEKGRISLGTCIGICVGIVQGNMRWYYTSEEVFTDDYCVRDNSGDKGYFDKMFDFIEDKLIEIVDGKSYF